MQKAARDVGEVEAVGAGRTRLLVRGAVPGPKSGLVEIRGVER